MCCIFLPILQRKSIVLEYQGTKNYTYISAYRVDAINSYIVVPKVLNLELIDSIAPVLKKIIGPIETLSKIEWFHGTTTGVTTNASPGLCNIH